jgi:hypothetical protein
MSTKNIDKAKGRVKVANTLNGRKRNNAHR